MAPDEAAFRADTERADFQAGMDRGDWQCLSIDWPDSVMFVRAAVRSGAPNGYALRFNLQDDPSQAPTAAPWDVVRDQPLAPEHWPTGERIGQVFNPSWRTDALYMPLDRTAMAGHDAWGSQHPGSLWTPDSSITRYLRFVRDLLTGEEYQSAQAA
jgi:hypothetical protein